MDYINDLPKNEKKTTDEILVVEVPVERFHNAHGVGVKEQIPKDLERMAREPIYDVGHHPDNVIDFEEIKANAQKCILVCRVPKEILAKVKQRIEEYPDSVIREVSPLEKGINDTYKHYDTVLEKTSQFISDADKDPETLKANIT